MRKTVRPIATKRGRERLWWTRNHTPKLTTSITVDEIEIAHKEAKELEWEDQAKEAFAEIVNELGKEGIRPGDRRQYKSIDAVQAYAYLSGASVVEPHHLDILAHILWSDPAEQPEKAGKIVAKIANPTGSKVTELLLQIQDVIEKSTPTEAVPKLQNIKKQLDELTTSDGATQARIDSALDYVTQEIKSQYAKVIGE
jgi:MoxR-like ATPase